MKHAHTFFTRRDVLRLAGGTAAVACALSLFGCGSAADSESSASSVPEVSSTAAEVPDEIIASGSCGSNAQWKLIPSTREERPDFIQDDQPVCTLIISGTGDLDDYAQYDPFQSQDREEFPGWFDYHNNILELIVEPGIQSIGTYAFSDFYSLLSVSLPDGLTQIGEGAFANCDSLPEIVLPDSVVSLGKKAFDSCYHGLTRVVLPSSLTTLPEGLFASCQQLVEVQIPEGVTSIQRYAFLGCLQMEEITLPEGLQEIGYGAFWMCHNLSSVTIPDSVTFIDSFAFAECTELASVTVPRGCNVASDAFEASTTVYYQ